MSNDNTNDRILSRRRATVTPLRPRPRSSMRVAGSDAPEKREVSVGFIPLTDCATVAVAVAMGFDRKHGLILRPRREASWAAVRDKLASGAIDAAHSLYGLIYGVQLGIGGPRHDMAVLMTLNQNGQAITFAGHLRDVGVTDATTLSQYMDSRREELVFAHTFPTGTHAMWLYYWLAAHGIHPLRDVQTITVPPPQMVTQMRHAAIDGYSAGEPWNAQAVYERVGFTVATSQQVWPDHPEKVLATTHEFVRQYPNTARALVMTLLEASRYIDDPTHHETVARIVAARAYVNVDLALIAARLRGDYEDGRGRSWRDPHALRFHAGGSVNYPYLSDGMWFMSQHRRWGLLQQDPDYYAVARHVNQTGLYAEAAGAVGVPVPSTPLRSSTLIDGRVWDGSNPAEYARSFTIQSAPLAQHHRTPVPGCGKNVPS